MRHGEAPKTAAQENGDQESEQSDTHARGELGAALRAEKTRSYARALRLDHSHGLDESRSRRDEGLVHGGVRLDLSAKLPNAERR
jgi:hypothetical protein